METAIGVFTARDHADQAVRELRQNGVPEESVVFLTCSESEAKTVAKFFGATVGGAMGGAVGVAAATLLLPGIGAVFALGFGAAALLGLAGAGAGAAVGSSAMHDASDPKPTADEKCAEDVVFFREVLKEGRSLVVVCTESQASARTAGAILDKLGLGMDSKTLLKMEARTRQVGDVSIVDVSGRITLGEGNVMLREIVRELCDKGTRNIMLNLAEVTYMDSSGVGELVKSHTTIRNRGGQLKLANLNKRILALLEITKLSTVFDIHKEEASAIESFGERPSDQSAA